MRWRKLSREKMLFMLKFVLHVLLMISSPMRGSADSCSCSVEKVVDKCAFGTGGDEPDAAECVRIRRYECIVGSPCSREPADSICEDPPQGSDTCGECVCLEP